MRGKVFRKPKSEDNEIFNMVYLLWNCGFVDCIMFTRVARGLKYWYGRLRQIIVNISNIGMAAAIPCYQLLPSLCFNNSQYLPLHSELPWGHRKISKIDETYTKLKFGTLDGMIVNYFWNFDWILAKFCNFMMGSRGLIS